MPGKSIPQTWTYNPTLDAPPKYRRACRYDAFLPDPLHQLSIRLESSVAGLVSDAESRILELNSKARPALAPMARLLLRTESIASSKVEGMQVGARELARAEARVEAGGKVSDTAAEILANIDAMELAIEEAASTERFGIADINAIHARLMRDVSSTMRTGTIRTVQNWIGGNHYNPCGADFVPPPPEHVKELLEDLCDAINDDLLPPVVQAALVHAQFETIHPFDDGNGRTGRALIHVVLRRRGLSTSYVPPISVVLAGARDRYISGLTTFRHESVEPWLEYFAGVASRAAQLASRYVAQVERLVENWRAMLAATTSPPRADAVAWSLIEMLPACPTISGPVAVAKSNRSRGKTYEALQILEDTGILIPLTTAKRNKAWEPAGLLDLIAEMG
ncbi:MAG: Fic family protein [Gemmatimonadota bacterium]